MKRILREAIISSVDRNYPEAGSNGSAFSIDVAYNPAHGDFSTNVAMHLAKALKRRPQEIAAVIVDDIKLDIIEKIEVVGPGFINFFIKEKSFHEWLKKLINGEKSLYSDIGRGKKVLVEFVSANPTGPLHVGHGRGAAIGDSVASIFEAAGYEVTREYYVNDAGNQMNNLAASILCRYYEQHGQEMEFPKDGYHGDYIADISRELTKVYAGKLLDMNRENALQICKRAGIKTILGEIDSTLKRFNVKIDRYFHETSLYESGDIKKALTKLEKSGATYEQDGALWLSTKRMGDEDDRVLIKSDGSYTYFTPDIAYHNWKFKQGYDFLIDVWGADHHGYCKRMECAVELMGYDPKNFDVILVQMVSLVKCGEKITMSTRAGEFVPLDWLIDEVGVDAARFFYNMRSANAQFEFDVDLAKTNTNDNPVFYVQYVHARINSLTLNAEGKNIELRRGENLELLTLDSEKKLIKKIMEFTYAIENAAQYSEPHRIVYYLQELAGAFHGYYYDNVIISPDMKELSNARLNLCLGVADVIKMGLRLLGVSAPERM